MPRKRAARQAKKTRGSPAGRRPEKRPAGAARPASPDDSTTRFLGGPEGPGASPPAAVLRVLNCPDPGLVGRAYGIGSEDVTLGRDAASTIALDDPDVSRHHARIVRTGSSHVLVDMESTNGISVNGKRVSEVTLRPGDTVLLGSTSLTYQA